MKKIVLYSFPSYGHINLPANLARELVKQGYSVLFYSTDEFRQYAESTGALYKSYPSYTEFDGTVSRNGAKNAAAVMRMSEELLPELLYYANKEHADYIIHDGMAIWGKIIGHIRQIPSASLITTIAFIRKAGFRYPGIYFKFLMKSAMTGKLFLDTRKKYIGLLKKYRMKPEIFEDIFMNTEKLNLVSTSSYFHPCADYFPPSFKFIGPSIYPRLEKDTFLKRLDPQIKIIFISLGTIVNDDPDFYRMCIGALNNKPYQVIISLGKGFSASDFPDVPKNIILKNFVNQLEVLQKADIFITHAGMNGVNESLYYGVPMILVPDTEEQLAIAVRTQELHAGILFKKKQLRKETLLQAIEKILNDPVYKENAVKIQKTLREAGGHIKGAQEIIDSFEK